MKQLYKKTTIVLLLCLTACTLYAQLNDLEKKLHGATTDTQRVNTMNLLAAQYLSNFLSSSLTSDFDSSINFANKAYNLSDSIHYTKGMGEALFACGKSFNQHEGHKQSLDLLYHALPFLKQTGSQASSASCMYYIADDLHALGIYLPAILYYDSSKTIFLTLKDSLNAVIDQMMKGHCYYDLGNYRDAFSYGESAYEMAFKLKNNNLKISCGTQLCNLFLGADLPQSAIDYMHQISLIAPSTNNIIKRPMRWISTLGGMAFLKLNLIDSAADIAQRLGKIDTTKVAETLFGGLLAYAQQDYQKALSLFQTGYLFSQRHNHPISVAWHANGMAQVYLALKNKQSAIFYANEALKNAEQIHALKEVKNATGLLADIYGKTKDYANAFYFGNRYKTLSDSLAPDEYRRVLAMIQVEHELTNERQTVQLLSKENLLKESNLQHEKIIRNAVLATLLALLVIGMLVAVNIKLKKKKDHVQLLMDETNIQLENKKKEQKLAELEREKLDLEMQALRAQMNPHFIFNCLSSINRFILKNETEAASDYLTKFSRLIRMVLTNSRNSFIVLEDELDMLRLYLDMERLRFMDAFDYSINLTNSIDLRSLFIPPLLLQPFAENAIWHGLMHKEGAKMLTIELSLKKDILYCIITDNGIGRQEAALIKTKFMEKQKSLGLQITADRLALINKGMDEPIFFDIQDLLNEQGSAIGTKVTLKIHCKNDEWATDSRLLI